MDNFTATVRVPFRTPVCADARQRFDASTARSTDVQESGLSAVRVGLGMTSDIGGGPAPRGRPV